MGLTTALDLATSLPDQTSRVVVAIESRPQPQVNRTLPPGMRWDSFAAAFGDNLLRNVKRRVQLIGMGLELMRYRADLLRLGTDLLLQPSTWHLKARGFSDTRIAQCERTAARLFTVLAIQPTDLSPGGAFLMDEQDVVHEDGTKLMYPYSNDARDTPERQAAIVAAGLLSVFLHADTLHHHLASGPYIEADLQAHFTATLDPVMQDVVAVNFRSAPQAADWYGCTGLSFPSRPVHERDGVNDNCEDRSGESAATDTSLVDRSLPPCADHPAPRRGR